MRTLKFVVDKRNLTIDPSCDLDGMFPAPNQVMEAEFSFSSDWDDKVKVVGFNSVLGKEFEPQILDEYDCCRIPSEALELPVFRMRVLGRDRKTKVTTNTLSVYQKGTKNIK